MVSLYIPAECPNFFVHSKIFVILSFISGYCYGLGVGRGRVIGERQITKKWELSIVCVDCYTTTRGYKGGRRLLNISDLFSHVCGWKKKTAEKKSCSLTKFTLDTNKSIFSHEICKVADDIFGLFEQCFLSHPLNKCWIWLEFGQSSVRKKGNIDVIKYIFLLMC